MYITVGGRKFWFSERDTLASHKWRSSVNEKNKWELFVLPEGMPTRIPFFHNHNVWVGAGLLALRAHDAFLHGAFSFQHPRTYENMAVLWIKDIDPTSERRDYLIQLIFTLPRYPILLAKPRW